MRTNFYGWEWNKTGCNFERYDPDKLTSYANATQTAMYEIAESMQKDESYWAAEAQYSAQSQAMLNNFRSHAIRSVIGTPVGGSVPTYLQGGSSGGTAQGGSLLDQLQGMAREVQAEAARSTRETDRVIARASANDDADRAPSSGPRAAGGGKPALAGGVGPAPEARVPTASASGEAEPRRTSGRPMEFYWSAGLKPKQGDTGNPICVSNVITVRNFDWETPYKNDRQMAAAEPYKSAFIAKCQRLGEITDGPQPVFRYAFPGEEFYKPSPLHRRVVLP